MRLRSLDCADDTGISSVKKDIAAMESALKKLEAQEAKYSAELDAALKEYGELKELRLLVCRTPTARDTIR